MRHTYIFVLLLLIAGVSTVRAEFTQEEADNGLGDFASAVEVQSEGDARVLSQADVRLLASEIALLQQKLKRDDAVQRSNFSDLTRINKHPYSVTSTICLVRMASVLSATALNNGDDGDVRRVEKIVPKVFGHAFTFGLYTDGFLITRSDSYLKSTSSAER